ncbi:MAG: prolyl oligopeptidase family serine peptidase [Candidatus Thermoplasmatota archaeon]|nr:prolyl oligopeptidase family serine peptidase [Candidatus Thermoplasmatota archaeon]
MKHESMVRWKAACAVLMCLAFVMPVGLFLAGGSVAQSGASAVEIQELAGCYNVVAQSYTAVIDKPFGNLIAVYNDDGFRMLGCDGGNIRGACAYWNDSIGGSHIQMDDGNCPETEITYSANEINVKCSAFEEQYIFLPDKIQVKMNIAGSDLFLGDDFHLLVGSEKINKNEFFNESDLALYTEKYRNNYLTDFTTDLSSGERSIINRHVIDDRGMDAGSVPQMYVAGLGEKTSLDGIGIWHLRSGKLWFEKETGYYASSARHKAACQFLSDGDGGYVVAQSFDYLSKNDIAYFSINMNSNSYTVSELEYPVSTNNGTNYGMCKARITIPDYPVEGGCKLLMANHGHGGNAWDNCFMWDFMANEGYIIAACNYTSDAGSNHTKHDMGYNQQIEIESLRQWVLQNYNMDMRRQYVTGLSQGGLNTFLCAINYPDEYAAIVPYSPAYEGNAICYAVGSSTDPYAISAGNPRERPEQLICPIVVVTGTVGFDTVLNAQAPLIMADHPDAKFFFSSFTGHDLRTWESYRKEVFNFIEGNVLSYDQANNVNGRFFGAISGQTPGYTDNGMMTYHNNSWISVGPFQNDTFTTINASKSETESMIKYTFKSDLPVQVCFTLPENSAAVESVINSAEKTIMLDGKTTKAISFDAEGGKEYTIEIAKGAEQSEIGSGGKLVPGFEVAFLAFAIVFCIVFAAKKRN